MSVPTNYRRLEYIESSGTQYIDTGVIGKSGIEANIDFEFTAIGSVTQYILGSRLDTDTRAYSLCCVNGYFTYGYYSALGISTTSCVAKTRYFAESKLLAGSQSLAVNGTTVVSGSTSTAFTTNYPMALFANNYAGSIESFASAKLYSCQIYDNGTLVRDYVPCETDGGEVGLWDDVNSVFYGNAGTGTFTKGKYMPMAGQYEVLEHIESSGTQYIDTGFMPNQDTRVVADAESTKTSTANTCLFGGRTSSSTKAFMFWFFTAGYSAARYDYSAFYAEGTNNLPDYERFIVDANKNNVAYGSYSETRDYTSFQCDYNLCLLASNTAGTVANFFTGKLYSCQIYDNGLLERDYIPIRFTTTGEIGLLDKVYGLFYPNAGTGTFTAGPVVDEQEYTELEYVESSGSQYVDTGVAYDSSNEYVIETEATCDAGSYFGWDGGGQIGSNSSGYWHSGSSSAVSTVLSNAFTNLVFTIEAGSSSNSVLEIDQNGTTATVTRAHGSIASYATGNYPLFAVSASSGTVGSYATMKAKYVRVKVNGTLIRDYIPMVHPSGVAGLYDAVNGRFYVSASTTDLTAGPEVGHGPAAPENFRVESLNGENVTLAWDASEGAVGYRLYRDGQQIEDTAETSVSTTAPLFFTTSFTLTAYNEDGESEVVALNLSNYPDNPMLYLITDRTQNDVDRVKTLLAKGWDGMTEEEQELFLHGMKGAHNASDLNRVEFATAYVNDYLNSIQASIDKVLSEYGVGTSGFWKVPFTPFEPETKIDWNKSDEPSVSDFDRYLGNVKKVTGQILIAKNLPDSMDYLNYAAANGIEQALLDELDAGEEFEAHKKELIPNTALAWFYSGDIYGGEV